MNTTSNTFSFHRWWLLVAKHWSENYKRYLLFLLAIAGLLLAWFTFILTISELILVDLFIQFSTYFVGLYLVGCLYVSWLFSDLSSRQSGTSFLALPASHLEKLLCNLFFGVLLFFIAYTLVFYLVDIPMVRLSNSILIRYPRNYSNTTARILPDPVYNLFSTDEPFLPERGLFLSGFFSAQALFLLGSVYFARWAFVKSVIVTLACLLILVIIDGRLINLFLPPGWFGVFFHWVHSDSQGHRTLNIFLPRTTEKVLLTLIVVCSPLILWLITWQRLKEKEL